MTSFVNSTGFVTLTVALGIFIDTFCYSIVLPFITTLVEQDGGTQDQVGIILSFFSAGLLLGSLVFGVIGDFLKRKKLFMCLGIIFIMGPSIWLIFNLSRLSLAISRLLQGFASGSIWVLGLSLIADTANLDKLGSSMAWIFSFYMLGNFMGPLVGGFLYDWGPQYPFLVIAILSVIDLVLRLMIPSPPRKQDLPPSRSFKLILSTFVTNRMLWVLMAFSVIVGLLTGAAEVTFALQLQSVYNLSSADTGLGFLAIVLPQTLTSFIGGYLYDRYGFRPVVFYGLLFTSVFAFLLAIPMPLPWFLVLHGTFNAISIVALTPVMPELVRAVQADSYSLAYGLFNIAFACGLLVGPIFGSYVFSYVGYTIYSLIVGPIIVLMAPFSQLYSSPKEISGDVVIA